MTSKNRTCMMVCLGVALLGWEPLQSEVITFNNVVDSYIEGSLILGNNDNNYGGSGIIAAHRNSHLWGESLLRVEDLFGNGPNQIPDLAVITNAQLHLWLDLSWGKPDNLYSLYQLTSNWDEFTVTSHNFGRVTDSGNSNGIAIDSLAGPIENPYPEDTEFVFDVTSSLVDWHSGASNFGWGLLATSALNEFFSSDSASESRRPYLTVGFNIVPEPTSLLLVGCALFFGLPRRGRVTSLG